MDAGVAGPQPVVHDDPGADLEPGGEREPGPGPHAAGEHDDIGIEPVPVGELHPGDLPSAGVLRGRQAADPAFRVDLDAEGGQVGVQQRRGVRVQLAFHQPFALLGQDHLGAAFGQGAGRRDAEEAAADHHRAHALPYGHGGRQGQAVVHGAERVDPVGQFPALRFEQPAQRREDRVGARGQDQPVVPLRAAVVAVDRPVGAVDADRPDTAPQRPPGGREGGDLRCVPAREHVRQQDPVVRDVRLLTEDRHIRTATGTCACACACAQPRSEPQAREAAADHHHTLLLRCHGMSVRGRCFPAASPLLPGRNAHLSARVKGR